MSKRKENFHFSKFKELDNFIQNSLDKYFSVQPWDKLYERTGTLHREIISNKSTIPDLIIYNKTFNKANCFYDMNPNSKYFLKFPRMRFILRPKIKKEYNPSCTYGKEGEISVNFSLKKNEDEIDYSKKINEEEKKENILQKKIPENDKFVDELISSHDIKKNQNLEEKNFVKIEKNMETLKNIPEKKNKYENEDEDDDPEWADDDVTEYKNNKVIFQSIPVDIEKKMISEMNDIKINDNENENVGLEENENIENNDVLKNKNENNNEKKENKNEKDEKADIFDELKEFMNPQTDNNNKKNSGKNLPMFKEDNNKQKEKNNDIFSHQLKSHNNNLNNNNHNYKNKQMYMNNDFNNNNFNDNYNNNFNYNMNMINNQNMQMNNNMQNQLQQQYNLYQMQNQNINQPYQIYQNPGTMIGIPYDKYIIMQQPNMPNQMIYPNNMFSPYSPQIYSPNPNIQLNTTQYNNINFINNINNNCNNKFIFGNSMIVNPNLNNNIAMNSNFNNDYNQQYYYMQNNPEILNQINNQQYTQQIKNIPNKKNSNNNINVKNINNENKIENISENKTENSSDNKTENKNDINSDNNKKNSKIEDDRFNDPMMNDFFTDPKYYNPTVFLENPLLIVKKNLIKQNWFVIKNNSIMGNFNSEELLIYLEYKTKEDLKEITINDYDTDFVFLPDRIFEILKSSLPKLKQKYLESQNLNQNRMLNK